MQKRNLRAGRLLWLGSAVILIGVPFHALLTAWFASQFGHFDLIRLWKELILAVMALASIYMVIRHPALRRDLKTSRLAQGMLVFIALVTLVVMIGLVSGAVSWQAALYGLIIDVRPFVFLLVLLVAAHMAPLPIYRRRWILIPAGIVIALGLLQMLVLPADFLRHFGYGAHTLPAFQPVDNKLNLVRIQSTLRGPNPLGAYLVPIIMSFVAMAVVSKKRRILALVSIFAGLVVMYGSYSRSAVLGLIIALWLFAYWSVKSKKLKIEILSVSVALLVIVGGLLVSLRNNDSFQNVVFHTNEKSTSSVSSNNARFKAIKSGLKDVVNQPLGGGVGSAGPASLRNNRHSSRMPENFYIQIAQETGFIGLILFLSILGGVGKVLYLKRSDILVRAALASLVGLLAVNMVSHAFADDTLAYVLFALLGYSLIRTNTSPAVAEKLGNRKSRKI